MSYSTSLRIKFQPKASSNTKNAVTFPAYTLSNSSSRNKEASAKISDPAQSTCRRQSKPLAPANFTEGFVAQPIVKAVRVESKAVPRLVYAMHYRT